MSWGLIGNRILFPVYPAPDGFARPGSPGKLPEKRPEKCSFTRVHKKTPVNLFSVTPPTIPDKYRG
jgi:hypothetical protein